jgi:hypothetical protein
VDPFVGTPAGHAIVPAGVKLAVEFVGTPAGQESVCVCAEPAPVEPFVGTPAGQDSVCVCAEPAPLVTAEPVKVSAGTVVLEPVNVSAGTVRLGAVALQAVFEPVPCEMLVAAQLPVVAVAEFVPKGVTVTVPFVPAAVTL